jgi:hypothetical protein
MPNRNTSTRTKITLPKAKIPKSPSAAHLASLRSVMASAPSDDAEHLFLGRAGESFVAAHLLRRGFNPAPLAVDTGVDLIVHREFKTADLLLLQAEHEIYQFQIKTTATNEYRSSLPMKKVLQLWHKVINLIVVFWADDKAPSAVVLPPSLIRMLTSGGFEDPKAAFVMTADFVSLRFIESNGRYFIRNYDNDITAMLNRFDRIEPIGTDTGMFPSYAYWADGSALVAFDSDEPDQDHA